MCYPRNTVDKDRDGEPTEPPGCRLEGKCNVQEGRSVWINCFFMMVYLLPELMNKNIDILQSFNGTAGGLP